MMQCTGNTKVLVISASGLVGGWLYRLFGREFSVLGTTFPKPVLHFTIADISDTEKIAKLIGDFQPGLILQPAALTHVDWCEAHPLECWSVNVEGTESVVMAAKKTGAGYIFFSSDYVFDGRSGPYLETDSPNPVSVYGKSKLAAEKLVQENLKNYLVIRTTGVYGRELAEKNFVMGLIKKLGSGQQMKVPSDQTANPTLASNLAEVVKELVQLGKTGIYNVAGADIIDRVSFAVQAAKTFGLDPGLIVPVTTAELGQAAARPLRGGLKLDKTRSEVKTRILGAKEGLERMKGELQER